MTISFPEPTQPIADRREVFLGYLDYFRSRLIGKIESLPEAERRTSRLPSGWTPLELLKHVTYVELRWIEWGFQGRDFDDPWAESRDGRWYVGPDETLDGLAAALRARGERTSAFVRASDLDAVGEPGERWEGDEPPLLERVLFHLIQEYARHLGHLDIVAELAGSAKGE